MKNRNILGKAIIEATLIVVKLYSNSSFAFAMIALFSVSNEEANSLVFDSNPH
ncbi:MAG: hypothetical protein K2O80_04395 [Helicobacter apodemus]|uniref:hypothetical protein n=1 Tax=Helicobacter apodemus TaxID=135569 RepID=UPI0018831271|nr:hypothetical protein [Helicobacter apodemus]MDE6958773.1 hypothetical protein [Helicobacter apodemus]